MPGRSLGPLHRFLPGIWPYLKNSILERPAKIFCEAHNFALWWNFARRVLRLKRGTLEMQIAVSREWIVQRALPRYRHILTSPIYFFLPLVRPAVYILNLVHSYSKPGTSTNLEFLAISGYALKLPKHHRLSAPWAGKTVFLRSLTGPLPKILPWYSCSSFTSVRLQDENSGATYGLGLTSATIVAHFLRV
jgi:hypothetical protein